MMRAFKPQEVNYGVNGIKTTTDVVSLSLALAYSVFWIPTGFVEQIETSHTAHIISLF